MGIFFGKSPAYGVNRPLVASAARVNLRDSGAMQSLSARGSQAWQEEAWDYLDAIGEIKYAYTMMASLASRIRLYGGWVADPDAPPIPVRDAVGITDWDNAADTPPDGLVESVERAFRLLGRRRPVSQLMLQMAMNLQAVGECYLVDHNGWQVKSVSEVKVTQGGAVSLYDPASGQRGGYVPLSADTPVGRVWRPHPRFSNEADAALKALRADCEELLLLNRMVRTAARSRLNAGILFVPDALSVAARSPVDGVELADDEDIFEQELIQAMTAPIEDESDASSVVPLLVRGPAELGDRLKNIELGRDVSTALSDRIEKVMDRILSGLDVPKEMVAGLAEVRYSNAMVITDSMYKSALEPLALLIADSMTEIFLRPLLRAEGYDDDAVDRVVVWFDPTEVVAKPDPAASATAGYDRFELSGDAWRQAHGFSDSDAPDEDELAKRLALGKVQVTPEVGQTLLMTLLPNVLGEAAQQAALQQLDPELMQMLGGQGGAPLPNPADAPLQAPPEPKGDSLDVGLEAELAKDPAPGGALPPREPVA